jgi:hypothetical protein
VSAGTLPPSGAALCGAGSPDTAPARERDRRNRRVVPGRHPLVICHCAPPNQHMGPADFDHPSTTEAKRCTAWPQEGTAIRVALQDTPFQGTSRSVTTVPNRRVLRLGESRFRCVRGASPRSGPRQCGTRWNSVPWLMALLRGRGDACVMAGAGDACAWDDRQAPRVAQRSLPQVAQAENRDTPSSGTRGARPWTGGLPT